MPVELVAEGTDSQYSVLSVTPGIPETVTLTGISGYTEYTDELGYRIVRFVFDGLNLGSISLPLEANPREPGQSTPVKKMRNTLENEPSKFHLFNNGMTLFASKCEIITKDTKPEKVILSFDKDDQGICNGGHTYFACKTAFSDSIVTGNFYINAEVIVLPDGFTPDEIKRATVEISRSRNLNSQLKESSMADQLGYFDSLRSHMPLHSNKIKWHENDSKAVSGAIDAELMLRLLACLCPTYYEHSIHHPTGKPHKPASMTAKSGVWNPWFDSMEENRKPHLAMMYPMAEEILQLRDEIARRLRDDDFANFRKSNLWKKYMCTPETSSTGSTTYIPKDRDSLTESGNPVVKIGDNVEVLILGLLRDNVTVVKNSKGANTMIGWFHHPIELLDSQFESSLNQLSSSFREANDEATVFCRNEAPYRAQLIQWTEFTPPPKHALWLWDIETYTPFVRADVTGQDATHRIDEKSGRMVSTEDPDSEFKYLIAS